MAALHEALDSCLAESLWARTPDELVEHLDGLHAAEQRLAAAKLAAVREIDASGLPCRQGANSATSWLRDHLRIGGGAAARTVRLARHWTGTCPSSPVASRPAWSTRIRRRFSRRP